jgi:signal transduction histidine kinase
VSRRLLELWYGPRDVPAHLRLEWRFALIRWIGIAIVAPGLLLYHVGDSALVNAYGVLAIAALYNTVIQQQLRRRQPSSLVGVVTALGDTCLNIAMMQVLGGGFDSPFSLFLVTLVVSLAMRFGYGPSCSAVLLFVAVNAAMDLQAGRPLDASFFFRSGVLLLTALLASFLVEQGRADRSALQASNDQLRRAYGDLANAHRELLDIDGMKSGFIANVSHELRTPLTSVRAYSELLLTYDAEPSQQREFVEIIHAESERLSRLIEEVLDISKIEAGEAMLHRAPTDVRAVVEASALAYRPMIEARGLAFEVELPERLAPVDGDAERLQQIVGNLLGNALKFTRQGRIRLTAENLPDAVLLTVSDTGNGIAAEHHERIFDKFQQLGDVLTAKPSGTGLGLAICRELVRVHGGRVWVESALGEGATFKVVLPAAAPLRLAEPAAPQRLEELALGQQRRLLNAPL